MLSCVDTLNSMVELKVSHFTASVKSLTATLEQYTLYKKQYEYLYGSWTYIAGQKITKLKASYQNMQSGKSPLQPTCFMSKDTAKSLDINKYAYFYIKFYTSLYIRSDVWKSITHSYWCVLVL